MKFWTTIASRQTLINMKATGYREGPQKSFGKNTKIKQLSLNVSFASGRHATDAL